MSDRRKRQRPAGRNRRIYDRRRHRGPLRILFIDVLDLWWRFIGWVMA